MTATFDIETPDGIFFVAPAFVLPDDRMTDWSGPKDMVVQRPDFSYSVGRFAQGGPGDISSANANGRVFVADELRQAHVLTVHTPVNINHQRNRVVGTIIGSEFVVPDEYATDRLPANKMPFPYVETLSAIWRYHYPDEYKDIRDAHEQGLLFQSMEAVSESLTCLAPGCCGKTYEYAGVRDASYCEALRTPRSPHRLNQPHFLGNALIIPPASPGWKNADITKLGANIDAHPQEAEAVYAAVADATPHLEPVQWEFLMAMVLAGAFDHDVDRPVLQPFDFERIMRKITDEYQSLGAIAPPEMVNYRKADGPAVSCGACRHFDAEAEMCAVVSGHIEASMVSDLFDPADPDVSDRRQAVVTAAATDVEDGLLVAAGLAVIAHDTGRVLLLQRAIDPADPASGTWEFPGGKLEPDEDGLGAAKREWTEEIGQPLPEGDVVGSWVSENGVYQGFAYVIAAEAEVHLNPDPANRQVLNPDDPDGDEISVAAWFDPRQLPDMPSLRQECARGTDWSLLVRDAYDDHP